MADPWVAINDHPGKTIALKSIYVDEEIIPLVNWFNEKIGVFTTFSCQGDETKTEDYGIPYIQFFADENGLKEINKMVYGVASELETGESIELQTTLTFELGRATTKYALYLNVAGEAAYPKSVLRKCLKWIEKC